MATTRSQLELRILRSRDGGADIPYRIRHHQRAKTLRITVSPYDGVVVTVPARARRQIDPEKFLREKREWVLKHLQNLQADLPDEKSFGDGSTIYFEGKSLTFRIVRDPRARKTDCKVLPDELRLRLPARFDGEPKDALRAWLKIRAGERIRYIADKFAAKIGVEYNRITIRDQRTKWGSCSKDGNLSFNWRLILFPPDVLRYIVIHELCHLRHFNHKPAFWKLVELHEPLYRGYVRWLKDNGLRMEAALL